MRQVAFPVTFAEGRRAGDMRNARRARHFFVAALILVGAGVALHGAYGSIPLILAAFSLAFLGIWIRAAAYWAARGDGRVRATLGDLHEDDPVPVLVTRAGGGIVCANRAARSAFRCDDHATLAGLLSEELANPAAWVLGMEDQALASGSAIGDIGGSERGLRVVALRAGQARILWRLERWPARSLGVAEMASLPMLTIGHGNAVLSMNAAARALIGEDVSSLEALSAVPLRSGMICDITTARGPVTCGFVETDGTSGHREVFLLPDAIRSDGGVEDWTILETIPVPLLVIESDGRIVQANRRARAQLGHDSAETCRLSDCLEGLGRPVNEWVEDAAAGRGTVQSEFLRVRRDDREAFVQVSLARTEQGGKPLLMAVLSDATELKSLQAQFVQSQKMQAIGQLAGGVAHDFNNLLTAISGHCDLLLMHRDPGDPEYADLMQIAQNVNRAAALVGQLLAFSRKQTMRPQILDLRNILADLTHLLNRLVGEQVSLILDHEPGLCAIRADKRQLEQVIMNLVVNARDAMPDGGDIRIVTRNRVLEAPLRRDRAVVAPGRYVGIDVTDNGCGIPPDRITKIFEPFFTTKRPGEGTGLGLSTAYGIVKQTGGFIFVDSLPGRGTTFQLLFPAHDHAVAAEPDDHPAPVTGSSGGGVVLLVEDEAPVRAFASRALRLRGFTVLEAGCAEDALELLADRTRHIDVFVSDVIMPGMDGPSWVKEALAQRPDVRVVFMSGYAEETFGDIQARLTNSMFLPKPFSLNELVESVERMMLSAPP